MPESPLRKHIMAMGGGGLPSSIDNPLLDQYVLRLVNKDRPIAHPTVFLHDGYRRRTSITGICVIES